MKKTNIKNYTSSVAADKSILAIERLLIGIGARNIAKEYDHVGKVESVCFSIPNPRGEGVVPFKLPAKKDAIIKLFLKNQRWPTAAQKTKAEDQAERTAWKNVKELVELQTTMIKLEQVEFMEVFLPYAYNMQQRKTIFEMAKENSFQKLLS